MKPYLIAILTIIIFTAAYSASSIAYVPRIEIVAEPQPELEYMVMAGLRYKRCFMCHQYIKWTPGKLEIE